MGILMKIGSCTVKVCKEGIPTLLNNKNLNTDFKISNLNDCSCVNMSVRLKLLN